MKTVAARPAAALPKVRVAAERAHVKTMRIHLKSLSPVVWTWNPSSFDRFFRVAVVAEVPSVFVVLTRMAPRAARLLGGQKRPLNWDFSC